MNQSQLYSNLNQQSAFLWVWQSDKCLPLTTTECFFTPSCLPASTNTLNTVSAKLHYTYTTPATDMLYNASNGQTHNNSTTCCTTNSLRRNISSRHVKMLECGKFLSVGGEFVVQVVELFWAYPLVVLYNISVAGVRVVEFGTNTASTSATASFTISLMYIYARSSRYWMPLRAWSSGKESPTATVRDDLYSLPELRTDSAPHAFQRVAIPRNLVRWNRFNADRFPCNAFQRDAFQRVAFQREYEYKREIIRDCESTHFVRLIVVVNAEMKYTHV